MNHPNEQPGKRPDDAGGPPNGSPDGPLNGSPNGPPGYEVSGRHWPLVVAFAVLALALLFAW